MFAALFLMLVALFLMHEGLLDDSEEAPEKDEVADALRGAQRELQILVGDVDVLCLCSCCYQFWRDFDW